MTLQNRLYLNNIRSLVEAREQTLTVLFKSDEMIFKRIYERDLKLKFRKLYKDVEFTQRPIKGFEVVFKGEKRELEKVVKYITGELDRKNNIYHDHKIK